MRGGREAAHIEKDTLREESNFSNTFLRFDALREETGPARKGHPEGWKLVFRYTAQKRCAEGGKLPRSKRTL